MELCSGFVLPEGCGIDDVRRVAAFLKENGSIEGRVVTLPCSTGITDEELETVVRVVKGFLKVSK